MGPQLVNKRTMLTPYALMGRVPSDGVTAPKKRPPGSRHEGGKDDMMRIYAEYVARKFPYASLAVERIG